MNTRALFAFLLFSSCLLTPSHGDWLVTVDGTRIETQGPYQLDGSRIIFKTTNGTLSAMRASEVDLDASRRLTESKKQAQTEAQPSNSSDTARKAALVLDENNTGRHLSLGIDDSTDGEGGDSDDAKTEALEVLSWEEAQGSTEDLVLVGRARNNSDIFATELSLTVTVHDETGKVAGRKAATFDRKALRPGQETSWRATFPGIYMSRNPTFESKATGFVTRDRSDGAGSADDSDDGSDSPTTDNAGSTAEDTGSAAVTDLSGS